MGWVTETAKNNLRWFVWDFRICFKYSNYYLFFLKRHEIFDFCCPSGKCLARCYSIILLFMCHFYGDGEGGLRSDFRASVEDVSWCFLTDSCSQQRQPDWIHPPGEKGNSARSQLTFINPFLRIKPTRNSWKSMGKWKMMSKDKPKFPLVANPRQSFELALVPTGSVPAPLIFPSLCLPFSSQNKILCSSTLTRRDWQWDRRNNLTCPRPINTHKNML